MKTCKCSDITFIEGLLVKDPKIERVFYEYCKTYFYAHYRAVFFVNDADKEDIFQNAFITLWQNIEIGKIKIHNGVIIGEGGKELKCSLTTYLMSIARYKNLELARSNGAKGKEVSTDEKLDEELIDDWLDDNEENAMYEVISDSISDMPPQCVKLLTKFYYENKKLDDMLDEIPEYSSKNALKSNKNRCLNRLKEYAQQLYKTRKNK